jgi:hypothetical protein
MGTVTPFPFMKSNPIPFDCFLFLSVCLAIYIWTIHNDPIALWDMRQPPKKQRDFEYFEVSLS